MKPFFMMFVLLKQLAINFVPASINLSRMEKYIKILLFLTKNLMNR